jgi:hypothetical protein
MNRLILASSLFAVAAFAQVTVTGKNGKTVKIGAGAAGTTVQSGNKTVKVGADGQTVNVDNGTNSGTVAVDGAAVNVNSGAKAVRVDAAGSAVNVNAGSAAADAVGAPAVNGVWSVNGGQGLVQSHACAANEDVSVSGQGHTLTLTGPCRTFNVAGQGNKIVTDFAERINVSGMNNTVSWKAGANNQAPKVSVSGMGNAAPQLK